MSSSSDDSGDNVNIPPLKRIKTYYFPGKGIVGKTKFYELRKAELRKTDECNEIPLTSGTQEVLLPSPSKETDFSSRYDSDADADISDSSVRSYSPSGDNTSREIPLVNDGDQISAESHQANVLSETDDDYSIQMEEERDYHLIEDDEDDGAFEEDDDESDMPSERKSMSLDQLKIELALWFSTARVTTRNGKALLQLLKKADPHSLFAQLPIDQRSLLPRKELGEVPDTRKMHLGEYVYIGVRRSLMSNPLFFNTKAEIIELTFHIDGVPLFNTSPEKFWPTLGRIKRNSIFLIALYRGPKDPTCPHEYLKDFIDEIVPYLHNGIEINGQTYRFQLYCLLADSPARAFLLGIKDPTGYYGCSRCKMKGERLEGRTCYPLIDDEEKRSTSNFYDGTNLQHKSKATI